MMINTDLHIHSCVSPCADREMTPEAIVARAREAGLELIAVCDHNTVRSCDAAAFVKVTTSSRFVTSSLLFLHLKTSWLL